MGLKRFSFGGRLRSGLGQAAPRGNAEAAGSRNSMAMSEEPKPQGALVHEGQRIAKVMARAGVCSRRDAEAWITQGRVTVNGKVLMSPALNVSEADDVRVDGKPLRAPERTRLFLFHKGRGLVTTARDPEGRPTVFEALPPALPRVVAVGRLDINTEGLLLLTNDGGLARVLELPSTGWLRRYRVRAHGTVDQETLDRLSGGITLDGVDYLGIEARLDREQGDNVWITMGLREGKSREIKKVLEHLGLAVNRLIRVSFGPFELGDLAEGEVAEVRTRVLREQLGLKLAREAGADFDAPMIERAASPPERSAPPVERSANERPTRRASPGRERFSGAKRDGERRFDKDAAPRRAPPRPSTPERRRKHVSALRAEIAADASNAKRLRKRVERGATQDRKGRTVTVERRSSEHGATLGRPGRAPPEPGRRPTPSESKAARDGKGRERISKPHRSGDGRPKGRKFDDRKSERTRSRGAPRREEDRRSERGPRVDFKPRGASPAPGEAPPRSRRVGRPDERSGRRPDDGRGAAPKPSRAGPGRSKDPPAGRGPRRPPRKS
jgi:23S rRNA pseudouridine2605 synthase